MMDAALCKHCRSELSWFKGYVCKPGEEHLVEQRIAENIQRQKDYEAELLATLSIARENYRELKGKRLRAMVLTLSLAAVSCLFVLELRFFLFVPFFFAFLGAMVGLVAPPVNEMQELESKYGKERLR